MCNPLISFIIPVYNTEDYIRLAIESVQNQNFKDWEIIAVNDGSTDKSGEIIDQIANIDTRIKVYHIKNHGVSHARNYALRLAKGKWISCMDSDDLLLEGALDVFSSAVHDFPDADTIRFHFKVVGPEGKIHDTKYVPECNLSHKYLDSDVFLKNIILSRWSNPFNSLTKREILIKNNLFFDENVHYMEDTLWHIAVSRYVNKCVYIPVPTYVYRYGRPGASNSKVSLRSVKNILGSIRSLQKHEDIPGLKEYFNYWSNNLSVGVIRNLIKFRYKRELFDEMKSTVPRKLQVFYKNRPDYLISDDKSLDIITNLIVHAWNMSHLMGYLMIKLISLLVPRQQKINNKCH